MIQHWTFARGGAWRNPKPTGAPYVCEQCRLDACGGNDVTLTLQAATTIELAPADVCADCGAWLLEESGKTRKETHDPQEMDRRRGGALGRNRG